MSRRNREFDTRSFDQADLAAEISLDGPAEITVDDITIENEQFFRAKAERMAFDNEPIKIMIHPSADINEENPVQVSVNGRMVFIFRNQPTILKRMYVEQLAKAKAGNVRQPGRDSPDPAEVNRLMISNSLKYPFSVLEDRNPQGAAWLNQILAQG
jgi:hypothetical protein